MCSTALNLSTPSYRTHRTCQAPEHLGQGVAQGMKYFGHTVKSGFTGVVSKPLRGAKRGGALGFVKGVGQGVVGLVAAPVSGEYGAGRTSGGGGGVKRWLGYRPICHKIDGGGVVVRRTSFCFGARSICRRNVLYCIV